MGKTNLKQINNKRTLVNLYKNIVHIVRPIPAFSVRCCLPTTHIIRDPNSYHLDLSYHLC